MHVRLKNVVTFPEASGERYLLAVVWTMKPVSNNFTVLKIRFTFVFIKFLRKHTTIYYIFMIII